MSTSTPRSRKSRLGAAMASKAVIDTDRPEAEEPEHKPSLSLAPTPAEPDSPAAPEPDAEPETRTDQDQPAAATDGAAGPVSADEPEDEPEAVTTREPDPVVAPAPEPKATTPRKKATTPAAAAPVQTAQVLAGVPQVSIEQDLTHLRSLIATGRDQRRYVEDLPQRTGKGTYLRLPVHIQDVLGEYCDRNTAPMADLIAALLDSYFRDIGALPPLGEGNRPVEKFFDKMRKETRSYDY